MINLFDKVDRNLVQRVPDSGPVTAILPVAGRETDVMAALQTVDHVTAYLKEDIPERYHYKDHRRVMPIVVVADEGWELAAVSTELITSCSSCCVSSSSSALSLSVGSWGILTTCVCDVTLAA